MTDEADEKDRRIERLEREVGELRSRLRDRDRADAAREAGQRRADSVMSLVFWIVLVLTILALVIGLAVIGR